MEIKVDFTDVEKLSERLSELGDEAESTANEVLHNFGVDAVIKDITQLLPVSSRTKAHAKFSEPFKHDPLNLGFIIKTKGGAANKRGSFGYLIFPDEGIGKRNKRKQDFTGRGVEQAKPKIIEELTEVITRKLQEGI